MTFYSTAELATRVLKDLGLVGAEETPTAADLVWTEEAVTSEIAMMGKKGIPIWNGSEVAIPTEYLTTLSRRIGLAVAPSFGQGDIASATAAMQLLEADLRRIGSVPRTGAVMESDYF